MLLQNGCIDEMVVEKHWCATYLDLTGLEMSMLGFTLGEAGAVFMLMSLKQILHRVFNDGVHLIILIYV